MNKPKLKTKKQFDYSECTRFIEAKYKIDTRDFARTHTQFGEWCAAKGMKVIDSRKDIRGAQLQFAEWNKAVLSGSVVERPYQDFWHWLIDVADVQRGGTIELDDEMGDGAEPWQNEILGLYLKEFGKGPYLTDW